MMMKITINDPADEVMKMKRVSSAEWKNNLEMSAHLRDLTVMISYVVRSVNPASMSPWSVSAPRSGLEDQFHEVKGERIASRNAIHLDTVSNVI
jgi:hypothetical protein